MDLVYFQGCGLGLGIRICFLIISAETSAQIASVHPVLPNKRLLNLAFEVSRGGWGRQCPKHARDGPSHWWPAHPSPSRRVGFAVHCGEQASDSRSSRAVRRRARTCDRAPLQADVDVGQEECWRGAVAIGLRSRPAGTEKTSPPPRKAVRAGARGNGPERMGTSDSWAGRRRSRGVCVTDVCIQETSISKFRYWQMLLRYLYTISKLCALISNFGFFDIGVSLPGLL